MAARGGGEPEDVLGLPGHGDCSAAAAAMVRACPNGMPGNPEHGVAAQEASFRSETTLEPAHAPKSMAKQQPVGGKRRRRDPKRRTARSVKPAFPSKRTLNNRGLPDRLEAHVHRLLMDAGWSIKPRVRSGRPKMAYYFTAPPPQREAVLVSLSQAWRFCGQRLLGVSGGSELGRSPAEWSDVDRFRKDLADTMDSVGEMIVDGSATLLCRWQLLDPFVAVVFIDKRITALQKHRRIRAVDSSTTIVHNGDNTTSPCSGYSRVSTDIRDGHQDVENFHHLSSSQGNLVKPELCCTQNLNTDVSGQAENHIQSDAGANLDSSVVKRLRVDGIAPAVHQGATLGG